MKLLVGFERLIEGPRDTGAGQQRIGSGLAHAVPEGTTSSLCGVPDIQFPDDQVQEWPNRPMNLRLCPVCEEMVTDTSS